MHCDRSQYAGACDFRTCMMLAMRFVRAWVASALGNMSKPCTARA